MIPKAYRLPLRKYPDFFATAEKKHFSSFSLFFWPIESTIALGAVIVSKKAFPKATTRNTLKRQVRAVLTPLLSQGSHKAIVVNVKKKMTELEMSQLQQAVQNIF